MLCVLSMTVRVPSQQVDEVIANLKGDDGWDDNDKREYIFQAAASGARDDSDTNMWLGEPAVQAS